MPNYCKTKKIASAFIDKSFEFLVKNYQSKQYLEEIRPSLGSMVNDHKIFDESKIQLTMKIKFISSKDDDESQQMQSKKS